MNIYDLIDAKENGTRVRRFANRQQLASYSVNNNKIFPKGKAKEGGPVKLLLRELFKCGLKLMKEALLRIVQ